MSEVTLLTRNERWYKTLRARALSAVTKATKAVDSEFRKNISLDCHSLADLRDMGHPYGRRNPQQIHSPDWLIHTQSGGLLRDSVQKPMVTELSNSTVGQFGFEPDPKPIWLVFGTTRMRPRPVVEGTLGKTKEMVNSIIKEIMKNRYGGNVGAEMS